LTVPSPALIGIDWGSSSFRAYLIARDGAILESRASPDGVATVTSGAYPATLRRLVGDWLVMFADQPVIASGMVGSRNGWREVPYVDCPADLETMAGKLVEVAADGRAVRLAPGLACTDAAGLPDVMRGEETEILGLAAGGARLVVLPGSHAKWAAVEDGRVECFKTFVTGEVFAAIRDHTLIGAFARSATPKPPGATFALGVQRGAQAARGDGAGLLGALFGARSLPLRGLLAEDDAGEYLSGLMIGAEVAEGRRLFGRQEPHVAGAEPLVERYLAAFLALGEAARAAPPFAAARGLHALALNAGLI
jgi:2-dehydro-3-deoxygalactonokinase